MSNHPMHAIIDNTKGNFSSDITRRTLGRIFRYTSIRVLTVLFTVGLGLFITLIVINLGGFVDDIMSAQIDEAVGMMGYGGAFDDIPEEELDAYIDNLRWQMAEAMGLHEPFLLRTARWWFKGITLQWGISERLMTIDRQSNLVKDVVFERIPYTLLLVGAANFVLFFANLWVAMILSSHRGQFWDRLLVSLTPISSAPSWVHGVILLAIFALELRILPFKGMFFGAPPENIFQYIREILEHMILPVTAVILSVFFHGVYTWRTFFIVHSGEDYVELAKAKGLSERLIRKRYLLRPTLPSVITSFALILVSFWESAIALEILFNWPGLGALFLRALGAFDRPVIVAVFVMFAYLLAISVVALDFVYAIIDPRVRIGSNGASKNIRSNQRGSLINWFKGLFKPKKKMPLAERKWRLSEEEESNKKQPPSVGEHQKTQGFITGLLIRVRRNIFKYPMATVGLILIIFLMIVAVTTVIAIPYDEAVAYWRGEGAINTPRLARPAWTNFFRREKWPESVYFDSLEDTEGVIRAKERVIINENMTDIRMTFVFDYDADIFPEDLSLYFKAEYDEKRPFMTIMMIKPDGQEMEIESSSITDGVWYYITQKKDALYGQSEISSVHLAFGDEATDYTQTLKGRYELQVLAIVFEEEANVDVEGVLYGKVFGLFGTDSQRRDLTTAMLWGTPIALAFGIIGATLTTLSTIFIAAISAWYGGWLDELLQRITELNITIPGLAMAILIYMLYSKSIFAILAIMIVMNIFGNSLKEYRAMFLQFKETPYIEAAKSYGASNWRIVFKYLLPRIIQVMVPQLVIAVPSFVFLEATLAYLGVTTPYLPTWGKVISQALYSGAYWGHYFWVLEPVLLVMITGLAFAFVGFALEQILNPRLRSR